MQKATDALRANELLQRGEGGGPGDMKTEPQQHLTCRGQWRKLSPCMRQERRVREMTKKKKKKKQGAVPAAGGTGPRVKGHQSVRSVRC